MTYLHDYLKSFAQRDFSLLTNMSYQACVYLFHHYFVIVSLCMERPTIARRSKKLHLHMVAELLRNRITASNRTYINTLCRSISLRYGWTCHIGYKTPIMERLPRYSTADSAALQSLCSPTLLFRVGFPLRLIAGSHGKSYRSA